jgi:predicted short-subunit dehydrogenase-like oxidoreductase (DUF2520 family)
MLTHGMSGTLSIIGAGRVGRALGRRLHQLGWSIGVVSTRSITTARAAVRAIGAGHPTDRLTHQALTSEVVLIAVPDAAIGGVAADLARLGGNEWRGKVVLHTSGARDSFALAPLSRAGAAAGSIHPMQTFGIRSTPELGECVFGIDGSAAAVKVAREICRQMGGVAVRLSGRHKAAYHAAGSLACSHILTLMEAATRLLMAQGFTRKQAGRALLPLARQTLDNFERVGPHAAWTGPMTRGDFSTLEQHAEALGNFPREYLDAYGALSRLSAEVLSADTKAALRQLEPIFGSGRKRGNTGSGKTIRRADHRRTTESH